MLYKQKCQARRFSDNAKRFHNPLLGATVQAYVEREWAENRLRERYDGMYRYDATAVAV